MQFLETQLNVILYAVVAVLFVALWFWNGVVRKRRRTFWRLIAVILSFVGAFVACLVVKNKIVADDMVFATVIDALENAGVFAENPEYLEVIRSSPELVQTVLSFGVATIVPVVFLLVFIVLKLVFWVLHIIFWLFIRRGKKSGFFTTLILTAVELAIILSAVLSPIAFYMDCYGAAREGLIESGSLDADTVKTIDTYVDQLKENYILIGFRKIGGDKLNETLTSFKVNGESEPFVIVEEKDGEKVYSGEAVSIMRVGMDAVALSGIEMDKISDKEVAIILDIANNFTDSKFLVSVTGQAVYLITDAWMNDQAFLGIKKIEVNEMLNDFMNRLIQIFHDDAKNIDNLQEDLKTLSSMVGDFAQAGVFANLNDTDKLLDSLSGELVSKMITTLGSNTRMYPLKDEITNIGLRAIASTLNIPENVETVYADFTASLASELNEVKALPADQQVAALTAKLNTCFADAGMEELDANLIDMYSEMLVQDLITGNAQDVTAADVTAFFNAYADNVTSGEDTTKTAVSGTLPLEESVYKDTVYARMTEEQFNNSGAKKLAQTTEAIVNATDATAVENAIASFYAGKSQEVIDAKKAKAAEVLQNVQDAKTEGKKSIVESVAGLKGADTMETSVVTLDQLLIKVAAAKEVTAESVAKDAEAIGNIFTAAKDVLSGLTSGEGEEKTLDIGALASSVGTIMDELGKIESFGAEKTGDIFTAVLQSDTVCEAAKLDKKTATKMAEAVTKAENVSYEDTFGSIGKAANLLSNDGKELTIEDIRELIESIDQSIANMLAEYVTPERLVELGMSAGETTNNIAQLIKSVFTNIASLSNKEIEAEAQAFQKLFAFYDAVSNGTSTSTKSLFSTTDEAKDGIIPYTADTTINIFLGSKAITMTLEDILCDETGAIVKSNPFGLGAISSEDSVEIYRVANDYLQAHADQKRNVNLVLALLGLAVID